MAWRLARTASRWKSALVVLMVLPLFIGTTTRTAGWMILFARGGMLDTLARMGFGTGPVNLMYAETAVIIGIIAINLPFTVLTLQSVFEGIDPRLEEAAASIGADPSRAFRRVVFPLALPGIAIAAVLCFILCMNAFATPVLLGGPRFQMMAPLLFWAFSTDNNWPFAAAIAFILMATTLTLTVIANRMIPRRYGLLDPRHRGDRGAGRGAHLANMPRDLLRGTGGLRRERLHLRGDHGEPLAGLARARRLDRCVQRQQVGLGG